MTDAGSELTGRIIAGYTCGVRFAESPRLGDLYQAQAPNGDSALVRRINPRFVTAFGDAAYAAQLTEFAHVGVLRVRALFFDEPNQVWYQVLEGLPDGSRLLKDLPRSSLNRRARLDLACQLAGALQGLHAAGLVHGNLWPGAVWLIETPAAICGYVVKLADAGLLDQRMTRKEDEPLLSYTAPERIGRQHQPDPPADLYAFGCILYELLNGSLPFPINNVFDFRRDRLEQILETLSFDRESRTGSVLDTCLRIDPARRENTIPFDPAGLLLAETLAEFAAAAPNPARLPQVARIEPEGAQPILPLTGNGLAAWCSGAELRLHEEPEPGVAPVLRIWWRGGEQITVELLTPEIGVWFVRPGADAVRLERGGYPWRADALLRCGPFLLRIVPKQQE